MKDIAKFMERTLVVNLTPHDIMFYRTQDAEFIGNNKYALREPDRKVPFALYPSKGCAWSRATSEDIGYLNGCELSRSLYIEPYMTDAGGNNIGRKGLEATIAEARNQARETGRDPCVIVSVLAMKGMRDAGMDLDGVYKIEKLVVDESGLGIGALGLGKL